MSIHLKGASDVTSDPNTLAVRRPAEMSLSVTSRHVVGHAINLGGWASRRRYELAPFAGNAALTSLAWAEHLGGVGIGTGLSYGAGTIAAGALAGFALKHKHPHLAAAGAGLTGILTDVGINAMAGPSPAGLITTAIATVVSYVVYVPWLTKRRHERLALQVQAARAGTLPDGLGLAATAPGITGGTPEETAIYRGLAALGATPLAIDAFHQTANGWAAVVTLPPGKSTSPAAIMAKHKQFAANMGLPGRLRLAQGPQGNQLIVRMDVNDPLANVIPWSGPSITSVKQPLAIGKFADGTTVWLDVMKDHILIAGSTDRGKSGIANLIVAGLAPCTDVDLLGIDMKPGALELGPWDEVMTLLADGAEGARRVLALLKQDMNDRGRYLATLRGPNGEPVRKWIPGNPGADPDSPEWGHGPAKVLLIDELAELVRQAPDVADELITLNQVARAMGIRIIACTQSPSEKAFGGKGTDARQQYGTRIGLGVNETVAVNLILGSGALGAGWNLNELDAPGKFMIMSARYGKPNEARGEWISDGNIAGCARTNARHKNPSDLDPTPPDGGSKPRLLKSVPCFPDGSEIPENRLPLWQALDQRGAQGATIVELLGLVAGSGLNQRTSISDPLQAWKARNWVVTDGRRDASKVFVLAHHARQEQSA
jgi:S-DNA-T family DNA segregation ATPase FtsK/SpoIIIE